MKNKVNPVAIGMFVLTAIVIMVVAVMIFGAAKFFADTEKCVSYFTESVNGLDVGAHVKYKGVVIGKVEAIKIRPSLSGNENETPVAIVYSIDLNLFKRRIQGKQLNFNKWLAEQMHEGLRAKLNYQSIVTGMLYIELDYLAERGANYEIRYKGSDLTEIPSAKTGLSEMAKELQQTFSKIAKINLDNIGNNLEKLLATANQKLEAVDSKSINDSTITALNSVNALVNNPDLKQSLSNFKILLSDADNAVKSMTKDFSSMSKSANKTMEKMDGLIANADSILAPQSPFRYELAMLLRNLSESLSSISNLSEYIQRNPSSILTGKSERSNKNSKE